MIRKRKFWVVSGLLIVIAIVLVGGLIRTGLIPKKSADLYEDPQGRFTIEKGAWEQVETDGPYAQFKLPDPPLNMYLLVLDAGTVEAAFAQMFATVGFDAGLLSGGNSATFGDWQAYAQEDAAGLSYGVAAQIVDGNAYVAAINTDEADVGVENAAVMHVLSSFKISSQKVAEIESYADLEALLRKKVDDLTGSISVAVVQADGIVYAYTYGEANPVERIAAGPETIYAFGSMTKVFTATALMQLVEQGLVDLDAWPGEYIPEFPENWPVTVRQLLTHSACFPDNDHLAHGLIALPGENFAPLEETFSAYVQEYPDLICEPGLGSNYSNPHYLALARIIEEVSGASYDSYVIDHLLTPLEMESTQFQIVQPAGRYAKVQFPTTQTDQLIDQLNELRGPGQEALILQTGDQYTTLTDYRILPPWGGLRGTSGDAAHFLQMHLHGGQYGTAQILQPETVAAMQEMQVSSTGTPLGLGLSWWINQDDFGQYYYHHGSGSGFENTMRIYPDLGLGVVVTANMAGYQRDRIAEGLVSAWTHEK